MSDPTFAAIKALLVPYAPRLTVWDETETTYDLQEDLPHARTLFAFLNAARGGVRLYFYPLNVFPELRAELPAVLADRLVAKYQLRFPDGPTPDARDALVALFAAAWERIEVHRRIAPGHAYGRAPDLDTTFAALTALIGAPPPDGVSVRRRTNDVTVTVPAAHALPEALAAKATKPGVIRLKSVTPAQYMALATIVEAAR